MWGRADSRGEVGDNESMGRGRLRVYLGAAPGVGKTVSMLDEGRRRRSRGTDVVVGFVEPHGRQYTCDLVEGLEQVPTRGADQPAGRELDLDAVLERRPAVVLVDELAHTNAPGGRHPKRWQDIQDLLDAGIDVISTVNIGHLESLSDVVQSITGTVQAETVPDEVVRQADQVELVDMSPEALRRRMAHGNVYRPEQVDAALANYFRVGNLSALRELALLWLAERVEEGMGRYRADHGIESTWATRERVVVAASGGPEGETLLRRGARIASRRAGGELLAVHVAVANGPTTYELSSLAGQRRLTDELGGTFHTVTGAKPAQAILDFARGVNASQVVIGSTRRSRWRTLLAQSTTEEVIAGSGDIDIHVVTHPHATARGWRLPTATLPARRVRIGYGAALLGPALLTGLLEVTSGSAGLPLTVPLYLLMAVLVALVGGIGPALAGAVSSALFLNWFFTPPTGTFTIAEPENVAALSVFVAVAAAVAFLVHRSVRRAETALTAQQESAVLAELTHTLLGSTDQMALLLERARHVFGAREALVVRRATPHSAAVVVARSGTADPGGQPPPGEDVVRADVDGSCDLLLAGVGLPADRRRLFAAFATHAGAILQRRALQQSADRAAALARDSSARTALLSAVSHDLRTPLAGIKAAIGSLRSTEVTFTPEDEAELQAVIEDSADRLETLIGNLLDMSRLQAGALIADPRPVDLGEIVPAAVAAVTTPDRVEWGLDPQARLVTADPGLLDRVLGNLVENALRHQPPQGTVRITTSGLGRRTQVRVIDTGPGIPEEARDLVFLPFQRHGDAPSGDGVGLGLAVARGLAEAMGGRVSAEETPGGGLTMVIELPAAVEDAHG
jgi:two-component system, OmpR family, sensor histidine kinase KdpD